MIFNDGRSYSNSTQALLASQFLWPYPIFSMNLLATLPIPHNRPRCFLYDCSRLDCCESFAIPLLIPLLLCSSLINLMSVLDMVLMGFPRLTPSPDNFEPATFHTCGSMALMSHSKATACSSCKRPRYSTLSSCSKIPKRYINDFSHSYSEGAM